MKLRLGARPERHGSPQIAASSRASLRANFVWAFLGNAIYAACQWLILIVLTKTTDPLQVGAFAFALTITSPVFAFCGLQLRSVQATDVHEEYDLGTYVGFRIATSVVAVMVCAICAIAGGGKDVIDIVLVYSLAKCFEALSDVGYGFLQHHERLRTMAISMIIRGVLGTAMLAICLVLHPNVLFGLAMMAATWALGFFAYDLKAWRALAKPGTLRPRYVLPIFYRLFKIALPLGVVIALNTLNMQIPRYVVQHEFGRVELGYFTTISYFVVAGATFVNAAGYAAVPRLAQYFHDNKHAFWRLLGKMAVAALLCGGAGILISSLFGDVILSAVYTKGYAGMKGILVWTLVAAAVLYVSATVGCGLTASRSFVSQAWLTVATTIATAAASVILIGRVGVIGGAMALAFSWGVKLLLQLWILARLGRPSPPRELAAA